MLVREPEDLWQRIYLGGHVADEAKQDRSGTDTIGEIDTPSVRKNGSNQNEYCRVDIDSNHNWRIGQARIRDHAEDYSR
jgi:hypothetical protein